MAQTVSGVLQPFMLFIGNLVFTSVALVGGLGVILGTLTLALRQAFVQYARQLSRSRRRRCQA